MSRYSDRDLGMHRSITRRNFISGTGTVVAGSLVAPRWALAQQETRTAQGYYPPSLTGMRGSHPGSFEAAHALRDGSGWSDAADSGEYYDMVVVGGGLSGLSAAYFFLTAAGPNARVLVLENHDDFGGHAKRNEFEIDGRLMIGYGGTMFLESPSGFPEVAKRLIRELGIDTQRFYTAYDREIYGSLGLSRGLFFDKETFGTDHLAVGNITDAEVLKHVPLSEQGKADLVRLYTDEHHYLDDMPSAERLDYLINKIGRASCRERVEISVAAVSLKTHSV